MNEDVPGQETQLPEELPTGESFHIQAEQARERGNFLDALRLTDEASIKYQQEGNVAKFAEVQSSRFLTFRHLFEQTGDVSFKILAQHAVESSVDIIRNSGDKVGLGIPLYNLAKWYETVGEYEKSIASMKEALAAFEAAPEDPQGLSSVKAAIGTRLAAFEYRLGDDSALSRFNSTLSSLVSNPHPDSYTQNVWVSGSHMHLADSYLVRGNKDAARGQAGKAKAIIDSDERLKLRAGQLAKLEQKLA